MPAKCGNQTGSAIIRKARMTCQGECVPFYPVTEPALADELQVIDVQAIDGKSRRLVRVELAVGPKWV